MRALILLLAAAGACLAIRVDQAGTGLAADEAACALRRAGQRFEQSADQVYFRFVVRGIGEGDRAAVEWVDPGGRIHSSSEYHPLPAAPSLCLLTALPVAGFPAAQQPGVWTVRVTAAGRTLALRTFEVLGSVDEGGPRVTDLDRREEGARTQIEIRGLGFVPESVVNIARYTKEGGWRYIAMLIPEGAGGERMTVWLPELEAAEYLVIVKNPDGRESPPARFLVASAAGYKLPTPEGVAWTITQGPYGGFSHYGRSRHAWDIAPPRGNACLVAMRGGTVHAFDLKLGQTPGRRIFGNYITIQHDDGEFSHYGHLRSGSFVVKTGQRVEQGHPLAMAGNSGYTVGQGGGHHVHVHVTRELRISAPSIPFRFTDLPGRAMGAKYVTAMSSNRAAGECAPGWSGESYSGSVAVTEVWSQLVTVARGWKALEVELEGGTREGLLDLSLMSPGGKYFALYAEAAGFGEGGARFRTEAPEEGVWRVMVRGMRGSGERVAFRVRAGRT